MVLLPQEIWPQYQELQIPLFLHKKLEGRPLVTAVAVKDVSLPAGFFIRDEISKQRLLADTGAMQSVFPPLEEDYTRTADSTPSVLAVNGIPIRCYRTMTRTISILGRRYHWPFIIAEVKFSLLGADFLGHHGLLVDVGRQCLLDTGTCHSRPLSIGPGMPAVCFKASNNYTALLQEFPEVFKPELRQLPGAGPKHGIFHHITTTGPPTHAKFLRLPPQKLQDAKRAFAEMEQMGICAKASSPQASPLHMGKKSDGSWKPCGDYSRLNSYHTRPLPC
ncbi:uncharacterized protein [Macrobrachium rosenbergii]|uniref:uncharacterized protein n=1 Tax=Macrobrachium rosenbergii TaxID=79674 RepID=UPI0034D77025